MGEALQKGENAINDGAALYAKTMLTSDEAARYMGISKTYLYKLTMLRKIPYYKPMGKMCYFFQPCGTRAMVAEQPYSHRCGDERESAGILRTKKETLKKRFTAYGYCHKRKCLGRQCAASG